MGLRGVRAEESQGEGWVFPPTPTEGTGNEPASPGEVLPQPWALAREGERLPVGMKVLLQVEGGCISSPS